ncbi:hypothetical protein [Marinospirillum sp.]|uniref:hypothetical protein n=1 Tax=Marinospirillum sp. TaxID=2183934 RepID=UPI002870349B|nr:hypothetical protein [Marinospirillum sp.]MDR9467472.1 hypothetical protein [Marinospirillum sp.]
MNETSRMNHNLAIVAVILAFAGTIFPWLLLPAVIVAGFAYRAIRREPERYSGLLFVLATWVLSLVVGLLYLILYLAQ